MTMYDIIAKKRDGHALSREELSFVAKGAASGEIPDYQLSALLMAMYLKGLDKQETVDLTLELALSGETAILRTGNTPILSGGETGLSHISPGNKNVRQCDMGTGNNYLFADKHSTGGVGDKITLIALPLAAAAGVKIAKFSGRSLGHTGGTIDKLSAIPGFKTSLEFSDFIKFATETGLAISGQTKNICPADKKLYALRDVTATVDYMPLIAASVMSKKLASGADVIVLDVKVGNGAFMKTPQQATKLAKMMVDIAKKADKKAVAIISDMSVPLGNAVGNSLEVIEAIEVLKNKIQGNITDLSVVIAAYMVYLSGITPDFEAAKALITEKLVSGEGLLKLKQLIINQGGNSSVIDDYSLFPKCAESETIYAAQDGYIESMDTLKIGMSALECGAGRHTQNDIIDLGAGINILKKTGDKVKKGEKLAVAHFTGKDRNLIANMIKGAYTIGDNCPQEQPIIHNIIQ